MAPRLAVRWRAADDAWCTWLERTEETRTGRESESWLSHRIARILETTFKDLAKLCVVRVVEGVMNDSVVYYAELCT